MAIQGDDIVGVVIQSPLTFPATLTPMERSVATAMADAIAEAGVALPGVSGEAATAATFAGQWSERTESAATPFQGNRLYELLEAAEDPNVEGKLRQAGQQERSLMILWSRAFQHEIGESEDGTELRVDRGLAAGQLWLWDRSGEPVSMALAREPLLGVVRLSGAPSSIVNSPTPAPAMTRQASSETFVPLALPTLRRGHDRDAEIYGCGIIHMLLLRFFVACPPPSTQGCAPARRRTCVSASSPTPLMQFSACALAHLGHSDHPHRIPTTPRCSPQALFRSTLPVQIPSTPRPPQTPTASS
jgi:hypothetical protein